MKKYIVAFIIFFFPFVCVFAQEGDIKKQTSQLSEVNKTIKAKQIEKDKLALQEKVFQRELKALNDSIEKNEKHLDELSKDIKNAQNNLEAASIRYNSAFSKSLDWNKIMLDEISLFHKKTFLLPYEKDPLVYKITEHALNMKKESFEKEKKTADASSVDIKKWEKAKSELLNLNEKEKKLVQERKKLMDEKNALLKNTAGRRAAAEAEIKALNESAKAMQALIKKLTQAQAAQAQKEKLEREQREREQQQKTGTRKPATDTKRRMSLPWPVDGKVITNFGKNKHEELDTYVISNGIKIKAADFSQVKSVDLGTVVFTGNFRSYGKVVIIDHKTYFSVYGQLDKILVKDEQKVSKGTVLATLGSGNESVLYFEIRQNNVPDNPMLWITK
ncbi:MAG: peptidoglycan DD-metalloendopeptidase family protein [Endomicrobia bacterium]|nr:peptidoglycan DD-metalloendopeptidase family protein [Endomicrobiia bacterium]MCL2506514.1 peptidoglycan DD-metalloendopeptidase family protein [Endomicrobiia bacterium]